MNHIIALLDIVYNLATGLRVPFINVPIITVFFIKPIAIIIRMIIKFAAKEDQGE